MRPTSPPKASLVLMTIAILTGGLGFVVSKLDRRAQDTIAVKSQVGEIERHLRAQDPSTVLILQEGVPPATTPATPGDALRSDLERLAQIGDLRLVPQAVVVEGDTASVTYRIEGVPARTGPPNPTAGEFHLRRVGETWALTGNQFGPGSAWGSTPSPRRGHVHRPRTDLVARLWTIAVLAVVAAIVTLAYPRVQRVLRQPRHRPLQSRKRSRRPD